MAFEIGKFSPAKLTSANFRMELHGKDHVPAVDLSFIMDVPNTHLSLFDGFLLGALYASNAAAEGQTQIEGVESTLPNLKFPKLGLPIKWEDQRKGYHLTIQSGINEDSYIELDLCDVGKFQLTPKEGGTVEIKFQVQTASDDLTEAVRGKLSSLIQSDTTIMLTPPAPLGNAQTDIDDKKPEPWPFKDPKEPETPESALAASVAKDKKGK
jgi:hypothetical protein